VARLTGLMVLYPILLHGKEKRAMNIETNKNHHSLLILGSGPAGCTAAIYSARANIDVALITGPVLGGQLIVTHSIDNWPGEDEGISGMALMENMLKQVQRFKAPVINDKILSADLKSQPFSLRGENAIYTSDALIIATGASPRYLGLQSEREFFGRGVSSCATCDGYFYRGAKVAVIGGGNTALEDALYLAEIVSEVILVHRRDQFRAEPILIDRLFSKVKEGKVKLELESTVDEILGDANGVTGLLLKHVSGTTKTIDLKGVFIAVGLKPNTEIFEGQIALLNGYITLERNTVAGTTLTSIPGVFAAGDVADPIYRQAITAAGSGCMAAKDAQIFLTPLTEPS
jgi:thioredoxin reductase (NADPH)